MDGSNDMSEKPNIGAEKLVESPSEKGEKEESLVEKERDTKPESTTDQAQDQDEKPPASDPSPTATATDPPAPTPIIKVDPSPPTPPKSSPLPMQTPAPGVGYQRPSSALVPDAPAPKPIPKDLPLSTPAGSNTPMPMAAGGFGAGGKMDISEFDPFATPSNATSTVEGGGEEETPVPVARAGPSNASATQAGGGIGPKTPSRGGSSAAAGARARAREEAAGQVETDTPEAVTVTDSEGATFNFSGFLKDLRTKGAEPIAKYLKSFLTNFAKKPFTVNEQIKLIHDFLAFIQEKMELCEPWKSQSEAEMDNAMEAMEKLVMNRLYNYTFTPQLVPTQPITTDDLERDAVFSQRVRLFSWIRERHLDVPESEASQGFLGFAQQELLKINHYKAPRDKMICILNCCKVIFGLLRHANNGSEDTSADSFVPILIFVVLQANPENMISNIEYINRFRASSRLTGEAGYYLSSLAGAIQFIETMDSSSLSNITQDEFEDAVSAAVADLPPSPTSLKRSLAHGSGSGSGMDASPSPFSPTTPGEEPARALSMLGGLDGSSTKRFLQRTGEVVSKPLGAIGKILEGMQGDDGDQSQSGSESGEPSASVRRSRAPEPRRRMRREQTPESPSQRLSQLGISDSLPPSGAVTPQREVPVPDFSFSPQQIQETVEASQETYEYTRRANIQTLRQMFPQLDAEILEAVLEGCNEDLGTAIDRLLEM